MKTFFLENLVQCCSSLRTWCRRASGWCPCSSCSTTWGSWSRCRGGGGRRGPGWTPPSRWPSPFQKELVSQILRRLLFIFTVELLGKPVLQFPATYTHRWEKWISLRKLEFFQIWVDFRILWNLKFHFSINFLYSYTNFKMFLFVLPNILFFLLQILAEKGRNQFLMFLLFSSMPP